MRILLDTCEFLWLVTGDAKLSAIVAARLNELPALHRDPFDRMIVCQAQAHGLMLASSDGLVKQYPVALL
jgi:PIN domain nuclease of toxin-antitoxin system